MAGFRRWLAENKGREGWLLSSEHSESLAALPDLKKQANDYAASFHDPIVLARVRKAMEAESLAMQRKLGIKTTRRRERLRK